MKAMKSMKNVAQKNVAMKAKNEKPKANKEEKRILHSPWPILNPSCKSDTGGSLLVLREPHKSNA